MYTHHVKVPALVDYRASRSNFSQLWVELEYIGRDIDIALYRLAESIYAVVHVHDAHVTAALGPECIIGIVVEGIWVVSTVPPLVQEVV